ncbi:hypothetical protein YC2023_026051 [Brassica napus]
MANQDRSSRRSLTVTTSSLHGKNKSMDISERGLDTGRRSLNISRSTFMTQDRSCQKSLAQLERTRTIVSEVSSSVGRN